MSTVASFAVAHRTASDSLKETDMNTNLNTNLRALVFGAAVAAVMTMTLNSVYAAEKPEVQILERVVVTAHANAA
jgi:hypothetical protein